MVFLGLAATKAVSTLALIPAFVAEGGEKNTPVSNINFAGVSACMDSTMPAAERHLLPLV